MPSEATPYPKGDRGGASAQLRGEGEQPSGVTPYPKGDRKGPHPAPPHSRPYNDYEKALGYYVPL
jgi:hypothetical protein